VVFQRDARVGAVLALEVVVVAAGLPAGGRRQLADAVEVVALGAVLPVVALGGAEVGGVDARGFVAAVVAGAAVGLGVRGGLDTVAAAGRCAGVGRVERQVGAGASSSGSRNGFCSIICSISWCSSRVESCSRRMDCCS